jgi:hypothetical protein
VRSRLSLPLIKVVLAARTTQSLGGTNSSFWCLNEKQLLDFELGESEMKKYMLRFLVAILAFSFGTTVIYISVWDTVKTSFPTQVNTPKQIVHSAENNSPYSVLEGTTVRIKPYDATFEIPETWVTYKPVSHEPPKNLYLSWQDLNELNQFDFNNGFSDEDDAQVMRFVFPFENCVAHVGSRSWGNGLANDLQVRVFVIDSNFQEITEKIKNQGLSKAQVVFNRAKLVSESYRIWEKQKMSVFKIEGHTLLYKDIDFYYRSSGNKTIVFVFMHGEGWDETIKQILDSFKWAN